MLRAGAFATSSRLRCPAAAGPAAHHRAAEEVWLLLAQLGVASCPLSGRRSTLVLRAGAFATSFRLPCPAAAGPAAHHHARRWCSGG